MRLRDRYKQAFKSALSYLVMIGYFLVVFGVVVVFWVITTVTQNPVWLIPTVGGAILVGWLLYPLVEWLLVDVLNSDF